MKFVEKYKVIKENNTNLAGLELELLKYNYDGLIDFCNGPICQYDIKNNLVLIDFKDEDSEAIHILKDGEIKKINPTEIQNVIMETIHLGLDYNLQHYFDKITKQGDVKIIIFYVQPDYPNTVFHPGYNIRCAALKHE